MASGPPVKDAIITGPGSRGQGWGQNRLLGRSSTPDLIITHKSSAGHGASGTTGGKDEVPSLAKEGWPRHQVNGPVPLEARPGWFVPLPIIGGLNQPPRLRPLRRLRDIFLMGAATPPCPRRGIRFKPTTLVTIRGLEGRSFPLA